LSTASDATAPGAAATPAPSAPPAPGFLELIDLLAAAEKPVVAAINGLCMGGGFEMSLACDLRIAGTAVTAIGLPETRVGIFPGGGGTQRLPRVVGEAKALEMILRGLVVNAAEALRIGLVHELAADPLARALEIAGEWDSRGADGIAYAKRLIRFGPPLGAGPGGRAGELCGRDDDGLGPRGPEGRPAAGGDPERLGSRGASCAADLGDLPPSGRGPLKRSGRRESALGPSWRLGTAPVLAVLGRGPERGASGRGALARSGRGASDDGPSRRAGRASARGASGRGARGSVRWAARRASERGGRAGMAAGRTWAAGPAGFGLALRLGWGLGAILGLAQPAL
jgi:hypothetical protein